MAIDNDDSMQVFTARLRLESAAISFAEHRGDDERLQRLGELERAACAYRNARKFTWSAPAQRFDTSDAVELRVEDFDDEAETLSGADLGVEAG